jgi:hypothetical protein
MGRRTARAAYNHAPQVDKKAKALRLRARGETYKEIGIELGISISTAHKWVEEEMKKVITPAAEDAVRMELIRYDQMLTRLDDRLKAGGDAERLIPTMLRVSKARRELLGLDQPVRVDAQVHEVTQVDLGIQEMVREAQAYAATHEGQPDQAPSEQVE